MDAELDDDGTMGDGPGPARSRDWSHDGTLGRAGELRGRPEAGEAAVGIVAVESMIVDVRDDETPGQSVDRRFEAMRVASSGPCG